jgi:hypothetical protein
MTAKLTITPRSLQGSPGNRRLGPPQEPIEVLFNPNAYAITKAVIWDPSAARGATLESHVEAEKGLNAPRLDPRGGDSRMLTFELFCDVTEPIQRNGVAVRVEDVCEETNKIVNLTLIERDSQSPPVCELRWGDAIGGAFPFKGVLINLTQNFTLFRSDGKPVRATLHVTFKEWLDPEQDKRQTDPELTVRIIKRGDSLSSIAAEVYGDPTRWRVIAQANRLDDPRRLEIGTTLTIPRLA